MWETEATARATEVRWAWTFGIFDQNSITDNEKFVNEKTARDEDRRRSKDAGKTCV
tara:strand:- start:714 stop:881 length:168 start_codon:yes stop_codon:yes gene_type:complete